MEGFVMKAKTLLVAAFGLICVSQIGCLLSHSNHVVVRQEEALQPVTFESEEARNLFESIVKNAIKEDSELGNASFAIPFIVGLEKSTKLSKSAIRNDVATRVDLNGDRLITEYEVSLRQ